MIRVVSLVPSLTQTVALTLPEALVGATLWCSHPRGLDVPRVGGPKDPDLVAIQDLAPDLVLMNVEENRLTDVRALQAAGVPVHVTHPRSVDGALNELTDLVRRLGVDKDPGWLRSARTVWSELKPFTRRRRVLVPVWRDPWILAGPGTFVSDVLFRLGADNLCPPGPAPYPRYDLADLRSLNPDLVVMPDDPYPFGPTDGPEAWPGQPCVLVSGRHLTWYGPSLVRAPEVLGRQLADN